MDDTPQLSTRLAQARKDAGLTQVAVAKLIDRTTGSVSNWERGERTPDFDEIREFAKATKADIMWLVFGETYQHPLDQIAERLARIEDALALDRKALGAELQRVLEEHDQRVNRPGGVDGGERHDPPSRAQES